MNGTQKKWEYHTKKRAFFIVLEKNRKNGTQKTLKFRKFHKNTHKKAHKSLNVLKN